VPSTFFKRAKTVLDISQRPERCVYRGETLREEKKSCCGKVEIFLCAKRKHEVWHTKCRSCEYYRRTKPLKILVLPWGQKKSSMRNLIKSFEQLGHNVVKIIRGSDSPSESWKDDAIKCIADKETDLYVGWQRLFGEWGSEVRKAIAARKIPTLYVDFGVWPHYGAVIFDPKGENAESEIVRSLDRLEANGHYRALADAQMAKVGELHDLIHEQATKATAPEGVPKEFIFLCLQNTKDSVLLNDSVPKRRSMTRVAKEIIREAYNLGKFVVVKPHPEDKKVDLSNIPAKHEGSYKLIPKAMNENLMAWLVVNAQHVVLVNSTVVFTSMLAGTPVVTLGKGWFTGNGVTSEFQTIRGAVKGPKEIDGNRVKRFMAHMLSRQLSIAECADPAKVAGVLRMFECAKELTVVTAIYAPDKKTEKINREALKRVCAALPDAIKLAPVDYAEPTFKNEIHGMGFRILEVTGGRPPRLNRLYELALKECRTPYILFVESDVWIDRGQPEKLLAMLKRAPQKVCCMEGIYRTPSGRRLGPLMTERFSVPLGDGLRQNQRHCSWSFTVFKTISLRGIEWKVPRARELAIDQHASSRLRAKGWILGCTHDVKTTHHRRISVRALRRANRRGIKRPPPVVVYTAIYGGKDTLKTPLCIEKNARYVCFTDDKDQRSSLWDVRYVPGDSDNPNLNAKRFKVKAHEFFPEVNRSVWVDGSIRICGPVAALAMSEPLGETPISGFAHPRSKTVFDEAANVLRCHREDPAVLQRLLSWYKSVGYSPNGNAFLENNCLIRAHNEQRCIETMADWWQMILKWTCRDQMTLAYVGDKHHSIRASKELARRYIVVGRHSFMSSGQWKKLATQGKPA